MVFTNFTEYEVRKWYMLVSFQLIYLNINTIEINVDIQNKTLTGRIGQLHLNLNKVYVLI